MERKLLRGRSTSAPSAYRAAPFSPSPRKIVARIFLALALFAVTLLLVNIAIGFSIGDLNATARRFVEARQELGRLERRRAPEEKLRAAEQQVEAAATALEPVRRRYGVHSLCGIAAALVTVLVNSVTVTYFVGTSRWCREVVETYQLDPHLAAQSQQLKRRAFPWAVAGMLMMIVLVALGAASDPGANYEGAANWITIHMMAAILGTALVAFSFLQQLRYITANYAVIRTILSLVQDRRGEAGQEN